MNYEVVIGIEVHCELKTDHKIFSRAHNTYGALANTQVSNFDFAMPGTMPVFSKNCLEQSIKACLALDCSINRYIEFDRKNYFYPDIPKGYQITQQRLPIGIDGKIEIETENGMKIIPITRLHMEEDTGKSVHINDDTLLDFNRAGSPLIEIVSDASIRSAKEAATYVENLRAILLFSGVSDVKMEEGSMRCDANISIRPFGQKEYGTKVEIKNINSISKLEKGLLFEIERQSAILDANEKVVQETRRFDDLTGGTILMRVKDEASDYRYHHEPDLMPVLIDDAYILEIQATLPKLPKQRQKEYVLNFGLSNYDAHILTLDVEISDMFDALTAYKLDYKICANLLMGDISSYLNKNKCDLTETKLTVENIKDIVELLSNNTISSKIAKDIIATALEETIDVNKYVESQNLVQISDDSFLIAIIDEVFLENEQSIIDYHAGKDRAFKYLVGQVMAKTKGKANPRLVSEMIESKLK